MESPYGSRPDLLPAPVVRLTRTRGSGARWVPRDGFELLSLAEHRRVEEGRLGAFSRRSDATIVWSSAPGSVVSTSTAEPAALAAALRALADTVDSFVVIWDCLALPSIRVRPNLLVALAPDLAARSPLLWICGEPGRVVLEFAYFRDTLVEGSTPVGVPSVGPSGDRPSGRGDG